MSNCLLKKYGCTFLLVSLLIMTMIQTNYCTTSFQSTQKPVKTNHSLTSVQSTSPKNITQVQTTTTLRPKPTVVDFGNKIEWLSLDEALRRNKIEKNEKKLPIFILFYSPDHQVCKGIYEM